MFRILHISDLHFGPGYLSEVGEAVVALAGQQPLDLIVASGDFTKRAKTGQYADARAFLGRLPKVPLIHTPGNHDVPLYRFWERTLYPYANYRRYIGPEANCVTQVGPAVIVTLNSTRPYTRIVEGELSDGQLKYAEAVFRAAEPSALRIFVTHHPFVQANDGDQDGYCYCPVDTLTRLKRVGVDVILAGHLHRSLTAHPGPLIVQCGTTTSRRGRAREKEKNSFVVTRINSDAIHVTLTETRSCHGRRDRSPIQ